MTQQLAHDLLTGLSKLYNAIDSAVELTPELLQEARKLIQRANTILAAQQPEQAEPSKTPHPGKNCQSCKDAGTPVSLEPCNTCEYTLTGFTHWLYPLATQMTLTFPDSTPAITPAFSTKIYTIVKSLVTELKETPTATPDIKRKWFASLLEEIVGRAGSSCSNEYFDTLVRLNSGAIHYKDYILIPTLHNNIVALGYRGPYETWNKIFYVGP